MSDIIARMGNAIAQMTIDKLLDRADECIHACDGIKFTDNDPTGTVRALIEALAPLADAFAEHKRIKPEWSQAARAALARVRIADGGDTEKGETK